MTKKVTLHSIAYLLDQPGPEFKKGLAFSLAIYTMVIVD